MRVTLYQIYYFYRETIYVRVALLVCAPAVYPPPAQYSRCISVVQGDYTKRPGGGGGKTSPAV